MSPIVNLQLVVKCDYPADDESRGRDRSHESGKSDVMGAVNELHPLPGRGNHPDGTNLLLREVKL